MQINLLRLVGNEIVLGECDYSDPTKCIIHNARFIKIIPTMGRIGLALVKSFGYIDLPESEVEVNTSIILAKLEESNIPKELLNRYKSEVSGIEIVDNPSIIR